ncbi:MAG: enolase C-terminal domain-like protein, partial [Wenzhouxiangellaceae bacterium]
DANGAWPLDTALQALRRMPAALIEQPVATPDIDALLDRCPPRPRRPAIAVDESCASPAQAAALIERGRIDALVIKPCTLGGLLPALATIEKACAAGIHVILSNLMESAIGRTGVAHLAAALPQLPGPHGLATGAWFARDLAADRIERGELLLHGGPGLGFNPGEDLHV